MELSITLSMPGCVVAGLLIGRDRYLDEFAAATANSTGAGGEALGNAIRDSIHTSDLERSAADEADRKYG